MKELLLNPADERLVASSINQVRKMRYKAVGGVSQGNVNGGKAEAREQDILRDAEELSGLIAHLMISYILGVSQTEPRELLDVSLQKSSADYSDYSPYSHTGASDTTNLLVGEARILELEGWETILYYAYFGKNKIPLKSGSDLSENLGIIAPLSMDYIRSTLHREFIVGALQHECFDLKPAAIHVRQERVVLPEDENGNQVFDSKKEIGVFVDVISNGDTVKIVDKSVRAAYPGKRIYSAVNNST